MRNQTIKDLSAEWHKLNGKMQELQKNFANKAKRGIGPAEHAKMNEEYFKLKEKMDEIVEMGRNKA